MSERLQDTPRSTRWRPIREFCRVWLYLKPLEYAVFCFFMAYVPVRTAIMWAILAVVRHRSPRDPESEHFDVICLSHVPWRHIWQRNHHTMSRLARKRTVVYMEHFGTTYIHWFARWAPWSFKDLATRHPAVKVRHPLLVPGESRKRPLRIVNRWIMLTHMRWHEWRYRMRNTVLWFYYPAGVYVLEQFDPAAVVYDIQDEYSAFIWAPRDIVQREQQLLGETDVIFAGTHALYEKKSAGFPGPSYFFPCAVEFDHFHAACPGGELPLVEPPELDGIGHPRLIYMGLIDARIDADLIEKMAQADPNWHIVMLGPIDYGQFRGEQMQEQYANIHFVGKIDYRRLPQFLAHCEVYIMPWMVNNLTRHINPTKTLEYLAAGQPVVSINLPDLQAFFGDYVALADSHEEFIGQCRKALTQRDPELIGRGIQLARSYSWEAVVEEMETHVRNAMRRRGSRGGAAAEQPAPHADPYGGVSRTT